MKQLLGSTYSRFRTQTLKSSRTSCCKFILKYDIQKYSQQFMKILSAIHIYI